MANSLLFSLGVVERVSAPLRRASAAATRFESANNRLIRSVRNASPAFQQLESEQRRTIRAQDQLADSTDQLVSATMARLVITTTIATAALATMTVQSVALEDAIARLATVTRGSSDSQETALGDAEAAARRFSTQWTASAEDVVKAQFQIATAGIPVNEQIAATEAAFKLARATMGDFTNAAQLLGSFLNTFGKSVEFNYLNPTVKMEKITDRLASAVQRFQVTLPVLAESFKFIVGPASQLNLKLSEVTAALGILNTAGFRGTLAGTALSNMFNKLDRAVDKLDLNPDKFIDLNGNLKDLVSFLGEVNRSLEDKTPIEAQNKLIETFDIRAGRVIKTLLNNIDALKKFSGELEVSRGATERMAKIVESTTSAELKKFSNALQNISTTLGGEFNESFRDAAIFFKDLAVSAAGFVDRNKELIVILGLTAVAFGVVATATIVWSIAVAKLGLLLNALTAAGVRLTVATAVMTGALRVLKLVFSKFTLIIGIIVAAFAVFKFAINAIVGALDGTDKAMKRTFNTLKEAGERFGSAQQQTAKFAEELERLGKTLRENIELPLRKGAKLGDLPFAQLAGAIKQVDPTVTRGEALKIAADVAGGFKGIADEIGNGLRVNQRYAESWLMIRKATDRAFEGLNSIERAAELVKNQLVASNAVMRLLAGGSQLAADALKTLADNQALIRQGSISPEDVGFLRSQQFSAIRDALDDLRSSAEPTVKSLVDIFDAAEKIGFASGEFDFATSFIDPQGVRQFREFTSESTEFFTVVGKMNGALDLLISRITSTVSPMQLLTENVRGFNVSASQLKASTKSITNLFKNASLGGESFADAFKVAGERLNEARQALENFDNAVKLGEDQLEFFKRAGLEGSAEFKELLKFLEDQDAVRLDLLIKFNDSQVLRESKRIFALIAELNEGKVIGAQAFKDLETLASTFGSTIGKTLSGDITGDDIFTTLADDFKNKFIGNIQKDIGRLLGDRFKTEFRNAIEVANRVIEEQARAGLLFQNLETGDLATRINNAIQTAIPGIRKLTGDNIFDLAGTANKLKESFGKVFVDASVQMVNATARTVGVLRRLQSVIGRGPAGTVEGLRRQATELRNILQRAGAQAPDAIRPVEAALKLVLARLKEIGPETGLGKLAAATVQSTVAINTTAQTLAGVIGTIVPAARGFRDLIVEGIEAASRSLTPIVKELDSRPGSLVKSIFEVVIGDSKLNVNIQGSGGSGDRVLEEDEIKELVDQARALLELDLDEKLSVMENELRGR